MVGRSHRTVLGPPAIEHDELNAQNGFAKKVRREASASSPRIPHDGNVDLGEGSYVVNKDLIARSVDIAALVSAMRAYQVGRIGIEGMTIVRAGHPESSFDLQGSRNPI
tara:strand:+ start:26627 stop:26953 length:327 start_codon:yes stop_codon:yes gene_type:complete